MLSEERNIILLGETGCGKSTFINYVANFLHAGCITDLRVAIPTQFHRANMCFESHEKALNDGSKSKTVGCHRYTFKLEEQVQFNFIDTPGINDTSGNHQDEKNIEQIFSYIQEMNSLTAIIFISNDNQMRLTPTAQYVIERLHNQIPQSIYNNILIIRTNWSGYKKTFRPEDFSLPKSCPTFYMQNSAYVRVLHDLQQTEIKQLEVSFNESMKTLNQVIKYALQLTPVSTQAFRDMCDERDKIKTIMHQSKIIFYQLQELEEKIALCEETAKIHEQNVVKFKDHVETIYVKQCVPIETPYHNTLCDACNCVCHEDCHLNETEKTGDQTFSKCTSISNGYCTVCPNRCAYTRHYHSRIKFTYVERSISNVIEAFQERYKAAHVGKKEAKREVDSFEMAKKAIEHELQFQYSHIEESVKKLQKHCANVNVVSELMQMIDDLQHESIKLKSESAAYRINEFIQKLKELCNITPEKALIGEKSVSECQENSAQSSYQVFNTDSQHLTYSVSVKNGEQDAGWKTEILNPSPNKTPRSIQSNEERDDGKSTNVSSEVFCSTSENNAWPNTKTHIKKEFIDKTTGTDDIISHRLSDKAVSCSDLRDCNNMITSYAECSTNRLIQISQSLPCRKKSKAYAEIEQELERRCDGKSIGYLNSDQQLILCEEFKILNSEDMQKLFRLYVGAQESIKTYTHGNVMKIKNVPFKLLCHITALYMILYGKLNDSDN